MALLTVQSLPSKKNTAQNGGTLVTMVASAGGGGDEFPAGNNLLLLAHNTDAGAQTITITSVADDDLGRTQDITAESIAAGDIRMFRLGQNGWRNAADGNVDIATSSTLVDVGILNLG